MLYGNVIFIKKSGGDGSKFPVTSTNVHIGRSDNCIIRIQNPLISPQHCQLTIESDGQARIKNLSSTNPTILNNQPLGSGKHVLRQGDMLKLGERFARWEYLPSSKHYYTPSQSSGSLHAGVAHYSRKSEGSVAKTQSQATEDSAKRHKTFTVAGRGSLGKSLRITPGSAKGVSNRKQLIIRHSLQLRKFGLSPQVKLRSSLLESSVSGSPRAVSAKTTPVRKSQKWEVKSVSPPDKVKPANKSGINRKSTPIKMPMSQLSGENAIKSTIRNASKAPNLLTIAELPLPNIRILSERITFDDVPEITNTSKTPKSPLKTTKTPNKVRINSTSKCVLKSGKKKSHSRALQDLQSSFSSDENVEIAKECVKFSPSERPKFTRSVVRKCFSENEVMDCGRAATRDYAREKLSMVDCKKKSPVLLSSDISTEGMSVEVQEEKKTPNVPKSGRVKSPRILKTSPVSTPKQVERLSRGKKSIPSGVLCTPVGKENVQGSPCKRVASSSKKPRVASTQKAAQNRGVKRKLSAIASAEIAAKKLKTIAPTKPDKNKKAALLVLGKASGKLKVPQNNNVVVKKKIVKRAIRQITKTREKAGMTKGSKTNKKAQSQKMILVDAERSPVSPETLTDPTERHSTPIGKNLPKRSSRKSVNSDTPIQSEIGTPTQWSKKGRNSSIGSISESDSTEVLPGSVPSNLSEKKSVSFNSTNSSVQYDSPDTQFGVKRPVSKRLRSQCGGSTPEFTELSPFALGLAPKRIDNLFKSPKEIARRSFSLTTPKNRSPIGIIKSASTSKINRKLVAFSDKDSDDSCLNFTSDAIFDLNDIHTPDVTIDLFVSPLSHKKIPELRTPSSFFKNYRKEFLFGKEEEYCSPKQSQACLESDQNIVSEESCEKKRKSLIVSNVTAAKKNVRPQKSPKNDLTDVRGVRRLMESAGRRKSPKNDLTDVRGVRRLMESAGRRKSPKNDLTDVRGVRRLMESAGRRKSPKNDLTDVRGVRRLMESAGRRKSPKNDLTDVRGVRRLFENPKKQKSPKNDLTDVKGVRKLMESAGRRKSPKNDLTDVRGVRRLMESAGRRKSPKNDLTDVRGVRRLFENPKKQKSPRNDLTDVKGVRRLMESNGRRKSPRNDLTDVTGVKQLLMMRSPKNDLTNVSGLETLFMSPQNKIQCLRTLHEHGLQSSDTNHNYSGLDQLFSGDENNLNIDMIGVAELCTPKKIDTLRRRTRNTATISPESTNKRPALRRATKAASKIVEERDIVKTRRKAITSCEVSVDQNVKVVPKGRKTDKKDDTEKSSPKRTRTRSERELKVTEKSKKNEKNINKEEVITGRRTRASYKITAEKAAAKRQSTISVSPTPVKRTRNGPATREKIEGSSKTASKSNLKKEILTVPERTSSPIRTTRKYTARESPKIVKKATRTKASENVPDTSRSLRQRTKTKTVKESVVSPVATRQRKARTVSAHKKESESSSAKTKRKAK